MVADATRRYKHIAGLEDVSRHVVFVRPNYFIMLDNLAANVSHQYEWISHFGERVSVEDNWVQGSAGGGQILGIGVASPQPFEATTGDDGYPYVRVQPASPVADMRFIHILYPTDKSEWETRPGVTTLDDTGEAAAVRVQFDESNGRTDDMLLTYTPSISAKTVGPYTYDGRVAAVIRGADIELERLFVYGGTFLTDQTLGVSLVKNLDRNEPFEVVYFYQTVLVYDNIHGSVTLYAPRAKYLFVNEIPQRFTRSGDYIILNKQ